MSPINLRDPHIRARVHSALGEHPHLPVAIERISRAAGIPEELVKGHLEEAVLETLEVLGDRYVSEMGAALVRVQRLRDAVHGFYERALAGQLGRGDRSGLKAALESLRDATRELVDPNAWAKRRASGTGPVPAAALEEGDPLAGVEKFDVDAHRPAAGPPASPARLRDARRISSLPEDLSKPFVRARELAPDEMAAALRGDPGARKALRDKLRGQVGSDELSRALDAVDAVRDPDPGYALGGGADGRPPSDEVRQAFRDLPARQRDAVKRAVAIDPEFVRGLVLAEVEIGPRRGAKVVERFADLDRFAAENDITGQRRADLEEGLRALNEGHREARRAAAKDELDSATGERREVLLDELAERLGLPPKGAIVKQLGDSQLLRDLAADSPTQLLDLAGAWLEASARRVAAGKRPVRLRGYVLGIMGSHVRGLFGELGSVFQLGKDFWVLKAPDLLVTEPGTDFVVVARATGEIWFSDNKTLSSAGLSGVTSLIENFGKNLAEDVAAFEEILRQRDLPPALRKAIVRAREASALVSDEVDGLPPEQIKSDVVQARIAKILAPRGIRRVVSNTGGELTELSERLQKFQIDLADLESAVRKLPTRRLRGFRPAGEKPGNRRGAP
ncbi:hypothetical protein [Kutzneria buriramensis]|uniref:Uncharacterized protein n=1 Tax=Kutzneria buriramensis TaxID=1045776 RepID=A0A3E0HHR2_9PSEU|nr:hypothetical protein [Kutzneria buriramensis]REH45922.1 hypothetical protein BCF44_10754 [Kutzneria buriramensis]